MVMPVVVSLRCLLYFYLFFLLTFGKNIKVSLTELQSSCVIQGHSDWAILLLDVANNVSKKKKERKKP